MGDHDEPPKEPWDRPEERRRPLREWAQIVLAVIVFAALIIAIIALAYFIGRSLWGSGLRESVVILLFICPRNAQRKKKEGHRKRKPSQGASMSHEAVEPTARSGKGSRLRGNLLGELWITGESGYICPKRRTFRLLRRPGRVIVSHLQRDLSIGGLAVARENASSM